MPPQPAKIQSAKRKRGRELGFSILFAGALAVWFGWPANRDQIDKGAERENLRIAPTVNESTPVHWPLNHAVISDDLQRLNSLLATRHSQDELDAALAAAVGVGRKEAALALLNSGANPNRSVSVLGFMSTPIIISVREGRPSVLRLLLERGADPNIGNSFEWRPVHHALTAEYQRLDSLSVLLEHGADVNAIDSLQRTALHRAAMFGHLEAARLLLRAGADRSLRDKYGNTAADRAAKAGHRELASILR